MDSEDLYDDTRAKSVRIRQSGLYYHRSEGVTDRK